MYLTLISQVTVLHPGLSEEIHIIVAGFHNDNTNNFVSSNPFDKLCWLRRLIEVYRAEKDLETDDDGRIVPEASQAKVQKWMKKKMVESGQDLEQALGVAASGVRIVVSLALDFTDATFAFGKEICSTDVSDILITYWYNSIPVLLKICRLKAKSNFFKSYLWDAKKFPNLKKIDFAFREQFFIKFEKPKNLRFGKNLSTESKINFFQILLMGCKFFSKSEKN